MRSLGILAIAAAVLFCTGCFEFREEIWVAKNGSGRLVADLGVSETLISMAQLGGEDPLAQLRQGFKDGEARAKADPNVQSAQFSENNADGMHHFIVDAKIKRMDQLGDTLAALNPGAQGMGGDMPGGATPPFRLERVKGGDMAFNLKFDPGDLGRGDEGDQFGKAMALSMLSGRYFTIILHAPGFKETNGEVDETGTTCTWQVSLADMVAERSTEREFNAVIDMPNPLLPFIIGGAALVLVIALVLIISGIARNRKRKPGHPPAPAGGGTPLAS